MKKLLRAINLLVVSLLVLSSEISAGELQIGDTVPDLPQQNMWFGGEKVSLFANAGKKATLLYFMKPGCGSCDKFAPHLYRLQLQNKDELSVVGITEYSADKINEYLLKRIGDYPIVQDYDRSLIKQYIGNITKYPYVAVIDKDGRLAWYGRGKFHSQVTDEVDRVLGKTEDPVCINPDGKKYALVAGVDFSELVGNRLSSPENNARIVAEEFEAAGYAGTELLVGVEANDESLLTGMKQLAAEVGENDSAVFYFSGDAKPVPQADGSIDLKLYLSGKSISLQELVSSFTESGDGKNLLVMIDGNTEKSSLKIWEDIAADVGKGIPGVTIILSAARWDRSMLVAEGNVTNFAAMLVEEMAGADPDMTPYQLWRHLRDRMSAWSRPKGILQSPFIVNPLPFAIGGDK